MTKQLSITMPAVAYDPATRVWRSEPGPDSVAVPDLDGQLVLNLTGADSSGDLGNLVTGVPAVILHPGSAADIAALVAMCHRHQIPVAARGHHHTTHGQSLARDGLAIEMTALDQIHGVRDGHLYADAGVSWRDVVKAVVPQGFRPAGLPGYLELTLGGTLSVGGISQEHREGGFVDRVTELEIVTGTGALVRCSRTRHSDLFHGALAGLGQVGIITAVVLELLPAPESALAITLPYTDSSKAFAAMRALAAREEIDGVFCLIAPPTTNSPATYQVLAHQWYSGTPPTFDVALATVPESVNPPLIDSHSYVEHVSRFDLVIEQMRGTSKWDEGIKPWFDVFLPDRAAESFVGETVAELDDEDWAAPLGFVLVHLHRRDAFTCPRLRVPGEGEWVWLFDILTTSRPGAEDEFTSRMLQRNARLWTRAKAHGGVLYPIGSQTRDRGHWRRHYGESWPEVLESKRRFDPAGILTPGVGLHHDR